MAETGGIFSEAVEPLARTTHGPASAFCGPANISRWTKCPTRRAKLSLLAGSQRVRTASGKVH